METEWSIILPQQRRVYELDREEDTILIDGILALTAAQNSPWMINAKQDGGKNESYLNNN